MHKLPKSAIRKLKKRFESEQPGTLDTSNKQAAKTFNGPRSDVILKDTKLVQTNRWVEVQYHG